MGNLLVRAGITITTAVIIHVTNRIIDEKMRSRESVKSLKLHLKEMEKAEKAQGA